MKVFISYGHDDNTPIVQRIERDLRAAGFEVWKDDKRIKTFDHWRRAIVDGLQDSDWVLGFLSKHSVRDPGVCLDELGIALHVKGGTIATVLLEGDAEPPVSLSHIQWLDMHDWRHQESLGSEAFEAWYRSKRDELLAVLFHPATQHFAGEIAELERRLLPVSQADEIGVLVEGFVGRDWLRAALDEWRRTAKSSRLFWLSGGAGTGKSAFAAWLAHHGKVNVIAINLCHYDIDERCDACRVVRTLAFQIATRLPDYRRLLVERLKTQDSTGEEINRKGPAGLFSWLLIEPLNRAPDGGRRGDRLLVVIDGLDETVRDGRSDLAVILSAHAKKLPPWIAIVATSRPEEPILHQFAGLQSVQIEAESKENLEDVRAYIREWLTDLDVPTAAAEALRGRLVGASEGNFLYLRMLHDAVASGTLRLDAPEGLPQGLIGLYERWFQRWFPDRENYKSNYRPVLEVIVAAQHPVPELWLASIFDWSKTDAQEKLEGLGSLFERRPNGVAPFHRSLRDWLVDPKKAGAAFFADEGAGAHRLVEALWAFFRQWASAADAGTLDRFCVIELPAQVASLPATGISALLELQPWNLIRRALCKVAEQRAAGYEWELALAWWRLTANLADAIGNVGRRDAAYAWAQAGEILVTLGLSADALTYFRKALAIAETLAATGYDSAHLRYGLSVSLNKVGEMLVTQGDLAGALDCFRQSRAFREQLVESEPNNWAWQRALSISDERIGDIFLAQGNLRGAFARYDASLARMVLARDADPSNLAPQHFISVMMEKIGDVQLAQHNPGAALKFFRDSLAIRERLVEAQPDRHEWRRDLSVSYNRIGDTEFAEHHFAAALESFRKSLSIRERLIAISPNHAGWQRDLSMSHANVGDVLFAQGDFAAAMKSFRSNLAIAERLAEIDPSHVGRQRDLSMCYQKIGDVLFAQGDLEGALKSFRNSLAVRERLVEAIPHQSGWRHDLWISSERVGDTLGALGRAAEAAALRARYKGSSDSSVNSPYITD